ncbi:tRNA glutamyl-Q(34) synthetase GluQRS [Roseateles terrae]|uniref:Glutamyl-Q tRNA(Asp) synthetase n=1 Tax=Roseateles terrae TaxID=431060 RepID=A0ABR6GL23_9BURK|nr:tRNA glutamyl-Q(34) synthetase GluQRS [Roseateles terrae]MBB3192760.1 glutamyl-Q tRNA(Asp) synthetase [Roseateles terrae]OWQ89963.1 tRNA glutamyl-Q(34) synthetase GluQRS [Roseateles terrae]
MSEAAGGAGRYRGRFAPSPTGPLHEGSLVAALASWLDARAYGGDWLVRIEDVDRPRCPAGMDALILSQLSQVGLMPDEPPVWQSAPAQEARYRHALETLVTQRWAYPCACSRKDIAQALAALGGSRERHGELVYPGTCRGGLHGREARAWRLLSTAGLDGAQDLLLSWEDRRLGTQTQNLTREVGDFVLLRADGLWAYQLAVVVDDGWQGITDVVRGEDLTDNTPRQIRLQQLLGLPRPRYLHTPLVMGENGEKLSKQNGAQALDLSDPVNALKRAAARLGLWLDDLAPQASIADVLASAVKAWRTQLVA